jgi:DNA modification methylase
MIVELPTDDEPVKVICGDCMDVLPQLPVGCVDAVITDPPYGMNWNTNSKRFTRGKRKLGEGRSDWQPVQGDGEPFDPTLWLKFPKVLMWGANHYSQRLPTGTSLVWLKKPDHLFGTFLSDAEVAWMKGGYGVYCFRDTGEYMATQRNKLHPTQKPVGLMRWCIKQAKVPPGGLILDPFGGSGTTAIAALHEGRRCLIIEKDAAYVEIIRRRVAEAMGVGKGSLLAGWTQPDLFPALLEGGTSLDRAIAAQEQTGRVSDEE